MASSPPEMFIKLTQVNLVETPQNYCFAIIFPITTLILYNRLLKQNFSSGWMGYAYNVKHLSTFKLRHLCLGGQGSGFPPSCHLQEWGTAVLCQVQPWHLHICTFLLQVKSRVCRTQRVPTYPWYFPSSSSSPSSWPVSDYYYKCLIYRIQASGSPQPIFFVKAHDVSSPNTDENTNTKTKTVTKTMT